MVNLYIHFEKGPVLQVSLCFCLYSTHYVFYIIINAVLFGHFTYLYGTVILLYLLYFLLPSCPDASVSVYTWISEGYIKVTLPTADCSFYLVTGMFFCLKMTSYHLRDHFFAQPIQACSSLIVHLLFNYSPLYICLSHLAHSRYYSIFHDKMGSTGPPWWFYC